MKQTPLLTVIVFVALTLAGSNPVVGQNGPVAIDWQYSFGGDGSDQLSILQKTSDGGYILGGSSYSGISGNKTSTNYGGADYWVIKLDESGNKIWENSFGGDDQDQLLSLQQTSDGGYILGGYSYSGISGNKSSTNYGYWVVKLDTNGSQIWQNSFGSNNADIFSSFQETSDGGYILGGSSYSDVSGSQNSSNHGDYDYWVMKLDAGGNKVWDKSFGGSAEDKLTCLQQTSDRGYILGGSSLSDISGNKSSPNYFYYDYWVVRLDTSGQKVWDKSFDAFGDDMLTCLQQTRDGGYVLGGYSDFSFPDNMYFYVVKLDGQGTKVWQNFGSSELAVSTIQQTKDGGYVLGGASPRLYSYAADYGVIKLTSQGGKVWDRVFSEVTNEGLSADNRLSSVYETSDGGYILGGTSDTGILGDCDFWVIKWIKRKTPDLLTGKTFVMTATNSVGTAFTNGTFLVIFASGAETNYRVVRSEDTVTEATGSYIYTQLNATNASFRLISNCDTALTFISPTTGVFVSTNEAGDVQSGTFVFRTSTPDFTGASHGDLLLQKTDGVLAAWLMNGTNLIRNVPLQDGSAASGWRAFGIADFNEDGEADIAFQNNLNGKLAVWLMYQTNVMASRPLADGRGTALTWKAVSIADFNSDGKPDILFQNSNRKPVVWFMDKTNFVSPSPLQNVTPPPAGWQIMGTGDFNGDGHTDIVWQHTDGRIRVWNLFGITFIDSVQLLKGPAQSTGWKIKGVSDFNLDGKNDLLWQNTDGRTAFWFFTNSVLLNSKPFQKVGTNWQIVGPK